MTDLAKSAPNRGGLKATPEPQAGGNPISIWVLITTILGSSMAFIDGTVVNVALPVLQSDLKVDAGSAQWVVESYNLFLAALLLVGGSLGDHYGRRRIFAIGVLIFGVASVLCGIAPGIEFLIFARALQGVGGALLVPGSLAIINSAYSPDKRGQAIGTWAGFTSITSAFGPVLGGWLVQNLSWRAVFFINIPMALAVLALLYWKVPESRDEAEANSKLDWPGATLVTFGLGAVVFGLINAGSQGLFQPLVLTSVGLGIVALVVFVYVEAHSRAPMMPLSLFKSRTFSGVNLLTLLLYSALYGTLYFFPFNLIQVQGYSTTAAGAAFLPAIFIQFLLSRWAGGLLNRFGAKLPLIVGPIIAGIAFFMYTLPDVGTSYWTGYFPAILVQGFGLTISVAPLTTAVMGSVDQHQSGVASGINNAVARTAGLFAIAVLGIFLATTFSANLQTRLDQVQAPAEARQGVYSQHDKVAGIEIPTNYGGPVQADLKQAVNQAFLDGFRLVMLIAAGLCFASALVAFLLIDGKSGKTEQNKENNKKPEQKTALKPQAEVS